MAETRTRRVSFGAIHVFELPVDPLPTRQPCSAHAPQAHGKLTASGMQRRAWLLDAAARCRDAVAAEIAARRIDERFARCLARTIHEGSHPEIALHIDMLVATPGAAASRVDDARLLLTELSARWESFRRRTPSPPHAPPTVSLPLPRKRAPSHEADGGKRQRTGKDCARVVRAPHAAAPLLGEAVR